MQSYARLNRLVLPTKNSHSIISVREFMKS